METINNVLASRQKGNLVHFEKPSHLARTDEQKIK
jgi:hypothetical protein